MKIAFTGFIFSVLFFCNCNNTGNNKINLNASFIIRTFLFEPKTTFNKEENFTCTSSNLIIKQNVNYTYEAFIAKLIKTYQNIDNLPCNKETKQYIKAMATANMVHVLFAYRFLGNYNYSDTAYAVVNWNNKSLSECYNLGNQNKALIWCGDRSIFYLKLLQKLLGINGTIITIPKVHSYPVVHLIAGDFILDPYDPFIVLDSKNHLVNYAKADTDYLKTNIKICRIKPEYGFPNFLLDSALIKNVLSINKKDFPFNKKIEKYVLLKKNELIKNIDKCTYETFNKTGVLALTNSTLYPFAINLKDNLLDKPLSIHRFNKLYFGVNCK